MCDVSYYGYFLTKRDHIARDLTELSYKCFDLIKVYGTATTTSSALVNSNSSTVNNDGYSYTPSSANCDGQDTAANSKVTAPNINAPSNDDSRDDTTLDDTTTWLHAKNMRTNAFGYILCESSFTLQLIIYDLA